MSDFSARRLLLATLVCSSTAAVAQNGNSNKEIDPYSRYGYGLPMSGTNVMMRGMGYTSAGYQSPTIVNSDNPASYAALKFTTYEAGLTGSITTLRNNNTSYQTSSATLAYLRLGIPIGNRAGISLGLQPASHVYYRSADSAQGYKIERPTNDTIFYTRNVNEYLGEGGLSYLYAGAGYRIGKFSLGFNAGYMFGNIAYTTRAINIDTTKVLNSSFTSYTNYGGIYWKGGLQFRDTIGKLHVRLGATATISQDLQGKREAIYATSLLLGTTETRDTAYHADGAKGNLTLPASYTFGFVLSRSNWSAAADFTVTNWSQFRNYDVVDSVQDQTFRVNVGGEYTPDAYSVYNYMSRVTYRLGFYYGKDYVTLRNLDMNYYAVTLGASFPFKRTSDRIHVATEFGRRGTQSNGLVQENFYKLHVGISLNDKWFIKRRYD